MADDTQSGDEIRVYGRYVVADPRICHGKLTFRGTRILVKDVLEQVAEGRTWGAIEDSWGGDVPREAIAEAVRLAHEALELSVHESRLDSLVVGRKAG